MDSYNYDFAPKKRGSTKKPFQKHVSKDQRMHSQRKFDRVRKAAARDVAIRARRDLKENSIEKQPDDSNDDYDRFLEEKIYEPKPVVTNLCYCDQCCYYRDPWDFERLF